MRWSAAALLLALGLLGALQYRWLREVADGHLGRMRADAAARAGAVAQDFDREITRAFLLLAMDAEAVATGDARAYAARYREFRRASRWPGLVREVLVRDLPEGGREGALRRFSPQTERLEPADWPPELARMRAALEGRPGAGPAPIMLAPEAPALLVPIVQPLTSLPPPPSAGAGSAGAFPHVLLRRAHTRPLGPATIVLLDRQVLLGEMLPQLLAERLRGEGGAEYDARVADTRTGAVVHGAAAAGAGDATADLFRLRLEDLDTAILKAFVPESLRKDSGERVTLRLVEGISDGSGPPAGRWRLVLRHKQGSVERAVQRALARNLAVGFSVLGLLAASVVLNAASARRARALAARQMEFVAAVSHELRTPLAVIRSAGENLADGIVSEPAQVRRYGGLVRDEGLRLTGMVEQVLAFAGAEAQAGEPVPVELAPLVERVLAAAAPGTAVERDFAPGLPPALGHAAAIERALSNLVGNALKYAGPGTPMGVRLRAHPPGEPRQVALTVWDRGPGIPADERGRLFEPFFRGQSAREAQAPGAGLGLAIVRRVAEGLGGRVEVESSPGQGASFTLVLPAAAPRPEPAPSDAQAHPAG